MSVIEIENLVKKYGDNLAVDNLNLKIEKGRVYGFLGPNGAGKSTTMNIITGYIGATSGTVKINGRDIFKEPEQAKKCVGYLPEMPPLYQDMTVREYLKFVAELKKIPKGKREKNIEDALNMTKTDQVENRLIRNLSKGYKQRVGIAQALIGMPEVIILDEPTVGLDPKQIIEIRQLIKQLGKKHTVILSSHILSEVSQICERVIIINKGKIIAIDTPENLEKSAREKNGILVTVEDGKSHMNNLKDKISEIDEIKLIKDNEDGTKQYLITSSSEIDLRKKLFEILPKEEIVIFELKKSETTLEDAFIKLIDTSKETDKKSEIDNNKKEGGKK